jgi:invasion protein IalB
VPRRRSSTEMKNQMNTRQMNPRRKFARLLPVAATVLALTTAAPAAAQQAAPAPAAAPAALPADLPPWIKTCDTDKASKKELCIVTQELRADSGTFIASATIRKVTGEKKYSLLATVPNGMLIKPGLKAQVDGNDPVTMVYVVCELHACLGVGDVDDAFVESMKNGKTLAFTAYSQQAKAVNFVMPLSGFGVALAGKALDAAGFKKLQEDRVAAYKARASKARDAMVKAQRDQAGEAAPAETAPAQ